MNIKRGRGGGKREIREDVYTQHGTLFLRNHLYVLNNTRKVTIQKTYIRMDGARRLVNVVEKNINIELMNSNLSLITVQEKIRSQ